MTNTNSVVTDKCTERGKSVAAISPASQGWETNTTRLGWHQKPGRRKKSKPDTVAQGLLGLSH